MPINPNAFSGDLDNALTIPREAIIEVLQRNLDEVVAERRQAEQKKAENRQEMAAELRAWTDDELLNFVTRNVPVTTTFDFLEWSKRVREEGTYKSTETQPTEKETSLEKYVRVLSLAENATIEVLPQHPIYPLL